MPRRPRPGAAPLVPRRAGLPAAQGPGLGDPGLGQRLWFPGEPVCRRRKAPDWVAKQRRLSRLKGIEREKYFTVPMLNALTEINRDCVGADPAVADDDQNWLRRHRRASRHRRTPAPEQGRFEFDL